jgi:hydroxyethylthiazole kinase-like uncharacterized protein yjeF
MFLRPRHTHSSKADFPKVGVYAGSPGMWGAAVLVLRTCYRMGAGYVFHFSEQTNRDVLNACPESLVWYFEKPVDAIIFGPGVQEARSDLLLKSIEKKIPLVLDAGAFDCMVKNQIFKLHKKCVLTPHEGEMARLLGKSSEWVKQHRKASVEELQSKTNACVVLKGSPTIIFDGERHLEISEGNAALAKAGSGDVLAGILGTLVAHNSDHFFQQIADGIHFHAMLSHQWVESKSIHSMTASDLIEMIPRALHKSGASDF